MTTMLTQTLIPYIRAAFAGIWIETAEPQEAQAEIAQMCEANAWTIATWDCAKGMWHNGEGANAPLTPLKPTTETQSDTTHLVILWNYHLFITATAILQALQNAVLAGKGSRTIYIILSPVIRLPVELEKLFVTVEHNLPDAETIYKIGTEVGQDFAATPPPAATRAAAGLTRIEVENAFSLSIIKHQAINAEEVWELKTAALKKSGLLELHRGKETFDDLGGLAALKKFAKAIANANVDRTQARGLMLLGVSGSGKSQFAKSLGTETGRPVIVMDPGSLMGPHVGQTEQQVRSSLRVADAMAPCILFIDEVEKALAGATGGPVGDNGVKAGMLGALLTWMQDHTSDVMVICTSNDISALPPEFTRAERFDAIFFLDLPTNEERRRIWNLYLHHFGIPEANAKATFDDSNWTGAEIKACCRLAALLNTTVAEASTNIIPVASTAGTKVAALREWASGKCLDASSGGTYHHTKPTNNHNKRRAISAN
jgi:hypothetical protein